MSLIKNSTVYLISNIANTAIPFLLLPLLTRLLSTEEYGQLAMFQTLVLGLTAFTGLNTVGAANRKYYDEIAFDELKKFNGTCFHILLLSIFLLGSLFVIVENSLIKFLSIPSEWLYCALLVSALTYILNFQLGQWQIRGKAKKYGVLQISNSIINMSLSVGLVLFLNQGAQGRVDANLMAAIVTAFIVFYLLIKEKLVNPLSVNLNDFKEALYFGVPLIPHVFGVFLISAADRFVINDKLGLAEAGIYMVAVQLSLALNVFFDAINKAYVPWLFNVLKCNKEKEKLKVIRYTYLYYFFLLLVSPFAFVLGPHLLVFIAGEKYFSAGQVIGLLCLGQIFNGMYLMVTNYVFYAKNTGLLAIVTMSTGILNIVLLMLLIKEYGLVGAALAFCISKFAQFIITWVLAGLSIEMPWLKLSGKNAL